MINHLKKYGLNKYAYSFLYRHAVLYIILAFFLISQISLAYAESKKLNNIDASQKNGIFSATFYKLGFLSNDFISYGINPSYTFYIPILPGYKGGFVDLHIGFPDNLRKDSYVRVIVDGSVYKNYQAGFIPSEIKIDLPKVSKEKFIKIIVEGYLRVTHNICDDINSRATYLQVYKDSTISINVNQEPLSVQNLFSFYKAHFLIQDNPELFPIAYYLSKYSNTNLYEADVLDTNKNFKDVYYIYKSNNKNSYISENAFYLSNKFLDALPYYPIALADNGVNVSYSTKNDSSKLSNKVSFKQLGIDSFNLEGGLYLSQDIPLDTAKIGGLPENLKLYLHIAHTPILASQNPSLGIYVNNILIDAFPAVGYGNNLLEIGIPSQYLKYGLNSLKVSLVLSVASENCYGSVPKTTMSILDDSYFKWDSLYNSPKKINDFISNLHGSVLVLLEDKNFDGYVVKFLNDLGRYDKNISYIKVIPWNGKSKLDTKGFDFVILFSNPNSLSALSSEPVKLNAGDFDIVDPLTGKTLFKASYFDGFGVVDVAKFNSKPALAFSFYKDPKAILYFGSIDLKDYYRMVGNVALIYKNTYTSYNVGNTLRVYYAKLQGTSYYWNKLKFLFVIILGALAIYFLFYVYKKLTKPPGV